MFSRILTQKYTENCSAQIERLQYALKQVDAIVIGAGSGLSTAAGFTYGGERFQKYFKDFEKIYAFHDMYSGVFYPYQTQEEYWGYFSRLIYINRYMMPPVPLYESLLEAVNGKDYFVLTTNVDHCFQRAGFEKSRLFYTQGDYGLIQCAKPCHSMTYDNRDMILEMLQAEDFLEKSGGGFTITEASRWTLTVPKDLVPRCPVCGGPITMNLRGDETFVEDAGWHLAADRYAHFVEHHAKSNVLFLELGVGMNTPGIIKYPFWRMTAQFPHATYICVNFGQAAVPREIQNKSICLNEKLETVIKWLGGIKPVS